MKNYFHKCTFKVLISVFSLFLLSFPNHLYAQYQKINFGPEKITIKEAFKTIESQTGLFIDYNTKSFDSSISISSLSSFKTVGKALEFLLKDTDKKAVFEGSHIIILNNNKVQVKGVVKDINGEALIGVTVKIKGTTSGTITGIDGDFSIDANVGSIILFSYIGYNHQEIKLKNNKPLVVTLKENSEVLDEVVVTALGIKRATKALSYNVQQIKSEQITKVKDAHFMNSLSGKVAGVNINSSSAGVGGSVRVVMRGVKSISGNNNALYVIDGVPVFNVMNGTGGGEYASGSGEGISDINPEDIENISVLTGPSAAALYGSDAANGVIVINTKKGSDGKTEISYSNNTTISNPFILPEFQNTYGNKLGNYASWGEKLETPSNYSPKDFFQTGSNVQNNLSLSTGNKHHQTYLSVANTDARGILPNHEYERYNFTFRTTTKLFDDKLTLDYGGSYIIQKDQNISTQGKYFNPLTALYTFPRGEDFSAVRAYERFSPERNMNLQFWNWGDQGISMQNPYWVQNRNMRVSKRERYMLNASAKYNVTDWINVAGRVRVDNSINEREKKNYASTLQLFAGENGSYTTSKERINMIYADLLVNIDKRIQDFTISANIGTSLNKKKSDAIGGGGKLDIANFFALNNVFRDHRSFSQNQAHSLLTTSAFTNVELGWKSMLYMTLTARNDWASSLHNTEKNSFFYPSIGLSGIISEMVQLPEFMTYLKVRASYAEVGSALPQYLSEETYKYNGKTNSYETYTRLVPDKLYPELTSSYEAGINLKFWKNKLSLDLTMYKSDTKKQTFNIPISSASGYSSMIVQSGCVENKGIEAALGLNLGNRDLTWNSTLTYTLNQNRIKSMVPYYSTPDGSTGSLDKVIKTGIDGGAASFILYKGGTMGDLWTKNIIKQDADKNIDVSTAGKISTQQKTQKVGSVLPKYNMGWSNEFSWKQLNFGFLISARVGGKVLSATQAYLDGYGVSKASADARDRGGVAINRGTVSAEDYYTTVGAGKIYSHYIYDATNVRLQEATIGYKLPKKWFDDICSVHLNLVGRNLLMIYNNAPFDPESTGSTGTYYQGIDYFMQPSLRSFGFNVKVDF